jgi:short-subunit dehydrogenase
MKMKILLATMTLFVSSMVVAQSPQDAIKAARAAQKEAKSVGFEWRDMGKVIKKAEAAAKDGKSDKAVKLANKVVAQSKQALMQAEVAKTAGPLF